MRIITLLFVICLVSLGAFFSAMNAQPVVVNYLFGTAELPLAVIVLISLALGILITGFFLGLRVFWLKRKNKRLNAKLKQMQNQGQAPESLVRDIK